MTQPTAAVLIIGDEILSGRTRDINMYHVAGELTRAGIDLKEARVVSDDKDAIISAVRELSEKYTHVFTSGGIGPTHDDITADCVAEAFSRSIDIRDDARLLLKAYYDEAGKELNEARLRMARIPDGAQLIDNPVSIAPGFSVENVHVMAGVPKIFAAMLEGLLPKLNSGTAVISKTLRVDLPESTVANPLGAIAAKYVDLSLGSYPFEENGAYGTNLVIRGRDEDQIQQALVDLKTAFKL